MLRRERQIARLVVERDIITARIAALQRRPADLSAEEWRQVACGTWTDAEPVLRARRDELEAADRRMREHRSWD